LPCGHGRRRESLTGTRRAVEIALREFPKLSSRIIAEMCGVSAPTVTAVAETCKSFTPAETVTGSDGKQYPATRRTSVTFAPPEPEEEDELPIGNKSDETEAEDDETQSDEQAENLSTMVDNAPAHEVKATKRPVGMTMAMEAINILRRIPEADPMRLAGLAEVAKYIKHTQRGAK